MPDAMDSGSSRLTIAELERPPQKRARYSPQRSLVKGKAKGRIPDPVPLLSIPSDVLFEVLAHVESQDLLVLICTCWQLRRHLLSPDSALIWRRSRQRFSQMPACPEDMSEQRWAALLLGTATCQECNVEGCHRVDFNLRRRICKDCRKINLVSARKFKKHFPKLDTAILELIPYTNAGGVWTGQLPRISRYYWRSDIVNLWKILDTYTTEAKQDFKVSRAALVAKMMDHANHCKAWNPVLPSFHIARQKGSWQVWWQQWARRTGRIIDMRV